jgi:hypothetical protein
MLLGGNNRAFEIPDEGVHNAVLAAVQDLGMVASTFDGREQPKVRFVWLLETRTSDGKPMLVYQKITNSTHEKSTLRKVLKGILGKDPGDAPFDDSKILGAQCQIVITHVESQGRTYANITAVTKQRDPTAFVEIPTGWKPPEVKNYTAIKAAA